MNALFEFFKSLNSYVFLHNYSRRLGNSPRPANKSISIGFDGFVKTRALQSGSKFYLVVKLKGKRPTITHQIYTNKLWGVENEDVDMFQYFPLIHKDYTADVVKWGISAYNLTEWMSQRPGFNYGNDSFGMTYPMKFKDNNGKYKWNWVFQECFPFEIDENNRIYSHLNEYTILEKFEPIENRKLFSVFRSSNPEYEALWNEKISEIYENEKLKTIFFTKTQSKVFLRILDNPDVKLEDLAAELGGISRNTVSKHTSSILQSLKEVFPDLKRLKTIVKVLSDYNIDDLRVVLRYYEN